MTHDPSAAFPGEPRTQKNMAEHQMIDLTRRMRRRAEAAEAQVTRLHLAIVDAIRFLDRRREDGIDFPYDSRPLRALRRAAPLPESTPAPKPSDLSEAHPANEAL